jgi:pSer/pThr/pTyr-binding forkhead associated (FHA) protein
MTTPTERRLPPIFPSKATLFSGKTLAVADLVAIDKLIGEQGPLAGYLVAEGERDALYLLFLKGKPYCAGSFREGTFKSLTIREFFAGALKKEGVDRTFDLFSVDPAVLLLIAVHFQKRPVLSVSTDLASPEGIFAKIEEDGRDSVVALVDGALRHVVFCQQGRPVRLYTAGEVSAPKEDSIDEVITIFCFERGGKRPVVLEVYDDLVVAPASDAGTPLNRFISADGAPTRYQLAVFEGAKQVSTRTITQDRCVIGRAEGVDLRLDDKSVSREHAAIQSEKGALCIRDLGSDNGTWVNNQRIDKFKPLATGDEIRVGRMRMVYKPLPASATSPNEETMRLDSSTLGARIVHLGQMYPVFDRGLVIGTDSQVDIKITGFLMRGRQARIYRDQGGNYWIESLGGLRRITVNGTTASRHLLRTGDAIQIGGETLRFYDAD